MRRDAGESLVELLVALSLLAVAALAIVGGFGVSVTMSDIHRKQATAGTAVRAYAEAVQASVTNNGYVPCATAATYSTAAGFTAPTGYAASVVAGSMRYWNGSAWSTTCTADLGLQRLTLQVASADGRAVETLVLVVRTPCRAARCA